LDITFYDLILLFVSCLYLTSIQYSQFLNI